MTTRSRRVGTAWETAVLRWVREKAGLRAERLRLAGKFDEGDIAIEDIGLVYLCELKAEQKINLSGYVNEARVEAANYAKARRLNLETVLPLAIIKRRGYPVEQAYVVTTLAEFFHC